MNMSQIDNPRRVADWEKISKYLSLAVFIGTAFFLAKYFNVASLNGILEKNQGLGFVICLIVYIVVGFLLIPPDPITLMILAWMGPAAAILLETLGDTVLALIDFTIGKNIGDLAEFEKKKARLPFHLDRLPMDSPVFLILARMLPGFGPKFVSIAGGVYRVTWKTFLWTTLVANLVGAFAVVYGGYGLMHLFRGIPGVSGFSRITLQ